LDALGQVHQAALQDLATNARALGVLTSTIVSNASSGSTQLGEASRQYDLYFYLHMLFYLSFGDEVTLL
jgi:hypothetical protein